MKKSTLVLWICGLILAFAIGFFAASALLSCKAPPPPEPQIQAVPGQNFQHGKKWKSADFKRMADSALGLSAEQKAKLDSNGKACDSLRREMFGKIHATEKKLHDLLDKFPVDEAALQSIRAELLLLNEKRLDQRIQDIKFFKSVLSAEQIEKLKSLPPAQEADKKRAEENQELPPAGPNGEPNLPPPPENLDQGLPPTPPADFEKPGKPGRPENGPRHHQEKRMAPPPPRDGGHNPPPQPGK